MFSNAETVILRYPSFETGTIFRGAGEQCVIVGVDKGSRYRLSGTWKATRDRLRAEVSSLSGSDQSMPYSRATFFSLIVALN